MHDLEGRFKLYIFQASYIAKHGLPRKRVDFYRSPGFQETKALCVAESDLNNSAPTTSCVSCYWECKTRTDSRSKLCMVTT